MMIMSRDWVSSVSYCSIYINSLPLDILLKLQLPPLHKFKFAKLKWFLGLMTNKRLNRLLLGPIIRSVKNIAQIGPWTEL